jgi:hypothetical protein
MAGSSEKTAMRNSGILKTRCPAEEISDCSVWVPRSDMVHKSERASEGVSAVA